MTEKTQSSQLEQSLWSSANALRGSMDASEYKNYLLGLIFYRFLSVKALKAFAENNHLQNLTSDELKAQYTQYLDSNNEIAGYKTRDITIKGLLNKNGYHIEPADLYSTLVEKIQSHEFELEQLDAALHNLEISTNGQNSHSDFAGLFADVDLHSNKLGGSIRQRNQAISETMLALNNIDLFGHDGDVLGDAYEYLIAQFASDAGKKAGEFYTPRQVSDIISQIVTYQRDTGDKQIRTIYDPAVGSGSLLLNVAEHVDNPKLIQYHGQELNTTTYNLARMNLMLHDVSYEDMDIRNGDTLDKDWPVEEPYQFDAVVMNPPYSAHWDNSESRLADPRFRDYGVLPPKSKADFAFLLHGLYHLKTDGTMGIVLPHGVLFRGAKEGKIRQKLLEDNRIDAVIGLPANIFHSTSIPTLILILKKDKKDANVMFIDASREFEKGKNQNNLTADNIQKIVKTYKERKDVDKYAHVAIYDEIKENDFNLNIPRYVDTFEPEPDIDIDAVKQNIQNIDTEMHSLQQEIDAMAADLVETDVNTNDHE
ncbi:type I restriction-modification system subunit M [Apilactobacillus xinyiensis]|uniref:type I restriction-modification system subunit M n=1 Tax=Apilactobacillus xinyiensis TaxID=2841032 RepID=UPI001C7D8E3C|nr:type I restriction-modification system subunit M [Apilactobacillus xinyiensis]MCL0318313.1 type I restriction-modification system subunit M [Apilactobacillus xinyiensis]